MHRGWEWPFRSWFQPVQGLTWSLLLWTCNLPIPQDNIKSIYRTLITYLSQSNMTVIILALSVLTNLSLQERLGEKVRLSSHDRHHHVTVIIMWPWSSHDHHYHMTVIILALSVLTNLSLQERLGEKVRLSSSHDHHHHVTVIIMWPWSSHDHHHHMTVIILGAVSADQPVATRMPGRKGETITTWPPSSRDSHHHVTMLITWPSSPHDRHHPGAVSADQSVTTRTPGRKGETITTWPSSSWRCQCWPTCR